MFIHALAITLAALAFVPATAAARFDHRPVRIWSFAETRKGQGELEVGAGSHQGGGLHDQRLRHRVRARPHRTLTDVPAVVTQLAIAPVKGLRVTAAEALDVGPAGPAGDRAFLVVDVENTLLLTTRTPALLQVGARWDGDVLALTFPDGREVAAVPELGAPATTANYEDRRITGRLVEGELADALSEHLKRPVRLLGRDPGDRGADDAPVTLMSQASLEALGVPDPRRFRMTITIDGVGPWEEHGWGGRELAVGDAVLRVTEPVPRCAVTTRDPDSGRRDAPTLKILAELRGKRDVTFGVWCDVVAPGRVRVGDQVVTAP